MDETLVPNTKEVKKKERPTFLFVFLTVVVTAGGPLLYGWNVGVLNNSVKAVEALINASVQAHYNRTVDRQTMTSWTSALAAIYVAGGALGTIAIGPIAGRFGRRKPMFALSFGGLVATILMCISEPVNSVELLVIARIAMGIHAGIYMGLAPMYIAECAAVSYRGASAMFVSSVGITFGTLLSSIFGLESVFGRNGYLWILFGIPIIPIILHVLGLFPCPPSPKYLAEHNSMEEASKALMRLRGASPTGVKDELDQIMEEVSREHSTSQFTMMDLLRNATWRRMLLVASVIAIGQQLSGINGIIFYSKQTFVDSGMSDEEAAYGTLGISGANLLASIIGLFLIDRVGRRPILLASFLTMGVTDTSLVPLLKYTETCRACAICAIIVTIIFIMLFQIGAGGIGWLITSEMFSQEARGAAVGVTSGINWICNLFITSIFPLLQNSIASYTFLIFAVINLAVFVFNFLMVRETKDKNPTEIEQLYT